VAIFTTWQKNGLASAISRPVPLTAILGPMTHMYRLFLPDGRFDREELRPMSKLPMWRQL
jgi:hypothetical protein